LIAGLYRGRPFDLDRGRRDLGRVLAPTQLLGAIDLRAAEVADD
jgi:hypothetical protein